MNRWQNELADRLPLDGSWEFSLKGHTGNITSAGLLEAQGYDRRADGPVTMQRTVYVPEAWRARLVQSPRRFCRSPVLWVGNRVGLDTGRLNGALPGVRNLRSLLRRLDARQYTVSDYLIEAEIGAGHLIASTLRFQGGRGDQPAGLNFQLAGRWLLYHLIQSFQSK